jgi:predicted RNA-binding protein with PIN domain
MPLMIDGHNLIGQINAIDLADPDDEHQLIQLLHAYCRDHGRRATVYFDQADPLSRDPRPQQGLTVRFVSRSRTADSAMRDHLLQLGREAKNWTVVSSDRSVRRAARGSGAKVLRSEQFAAQLMAPPPAPDAPEKPEAPRADQLDEWLRLFSGEGGDSD